MLQCFSQYEKKHIVFCDLKSSGQIITTSAEVTLNGGLIRELPQNPLNSGLGIILICPEIIEPTIYWKQHTSPCTTLCNLQAVSCLTKMDPLWLVVSSILKFFIPDLGEDEPIFDEHIFQMGGEKPPTRTGTTLEHQKLLPRKLTCPLKNCGCKTIHSQMGGEKPPTSSGRWIWTRSSCRRGCCTTCNRPPGRTRLDFFCGSGKWENDRLGSPGCCLVETFFGILV